MNIFDILLNVKRPKIESIHSTIPEEVKQEILNWLGDIAENLDGIARVLENNGRF